MNLSTRPSTIDQLLARSNNCHVRKIFDKPEKKGSGKTRELAGEPTGYMVLSLLFFHNLTRHKNGGQSLKRSHDLSLSEAVPWQLHAALSVRSRNGRSGRGCRHPCHQDSLSLSFRPCVPLHGVHLNRRLWGFSGPYGFATCGPT